MGWTSAIVCWFLYGQRELLFVFQGGGRNIALVSNDLVDTYLVITTRSFLEESDIYYYIFFYLLLLMTIFIIDF